MVQEKLSYIANLLGVDFGSDKVWVIWVQSVSVHVIVLARFVEPLQREGREIARSNMRQRFKGVVINGLMISCCPFLSSHLTALLVARLGVDDIRRVRH